MRSVYYLSLLRPRGGGGLSLSSSPGYAKLYLTNMTTNAKKILYVITKANWGGAQHYVYDMALAMRERGYAVTVAHGTEGPLVEKLAEAGIRTLPLPGVERDVAMFDTSRSGFRPGAIFSSVGREIHVLKMLVRLFKEERPDILNLNSSKIGGLGALAGRFAKIPRIIFTAHGWAFNERRPWWQKVVFHALYAVTLWLSHKTIAVSEGIRRDMQWLPGGKMTVVKHGMDAPDFIARAKARTALLSEHKDSFWIGMTAELHPTKRVEDAIDALAELNGVRPDAILVVMGDGELKSWLQERIAYWKLEKRVFLLGFVPEASRFLKAFDMFLMPSRTEALGLALVEAGYAGLPSIATRVGGIPEVIKHKETGLLVPAENPHALARAMRTYIEHPELAKEYGENFEKSVREKFGKERMIEETLAVYKS